MNVEYHKWHSPSLSREMELKVYGHAGKGVVVFPSARGRFYDYEDFGMVGACAPFIDDGKIVLCAVDGVDGESWMNEGAPPADRAARHEAYDRYVVEEVAPFLRRRGHREGFVATGCSMGAYHAANAFFRHPDVFDAVIALSGVYQLSRFIGGYMDERVRRNTPIAFLSGLTDPWFLDRYRRGRIILCTGQGAWEDDMVADTLAMKGILEAKGVPCWADFWGYDVNHDWPWWRKQIPYFLGHLDLAPHDGPA